MDAAPLAAIAVRRQLGRSGRTFQGDDAMRRELAAAGSSSSGGQKPETTADEAPSARAFNYPKGRVVKSAAGSYLIMLLTMSR